MEGLIELCCATCEFAVPDGEKVTCAYDGNQTTADWFCRHWEERENESYREYCNVKLIKDAIAQEPRVMTLEEVNALDWDYCYLEQERLPGKEYRGMLGKYMMTCVTWPSITAAKISQGKDNYGRTWRCWTSRPTDAQREAVKWK